MKLTEKTLRVLNYVSSRKSPMQAKHVAQHFSISQSTAAVFLKKLYDAKKLYRRRIANQIYWSPNPIIEEKDSKADLAVPSKPASVQKVKPTADGRPGWPPSPFKSTSYPHIRGYDD